MAHWLLLFWKVWRGDNWLPLPTRVRNWGSFWGIFFLFRCNAQFDRIFLAFVLLCPCVRSVADFTGSVATAAIAANTLASGRTSSAVAANQIAAATIMDSTATAATTQALGKSPIEETDEEEQLLAMTTTVLEPKSHKSSGNGSKICVSTWFFPRKFQLFPSLNRWTKTKRIRSVDALN